MSLAAFFGGIAVLLSIAGNGVYIIDILRGRTKPHLYTFLVVFSVITIIAFIGQWVSGAGPGSWATAVNGVLTIMVCVLAMRFGTTDRTKTDLVFVFAAFLAIIPWLLTKDPTLSVVLASLINMFAYLPTLRKTWHAPGTESVLSWSLSAPKHALALLATNAWSLNTVLYIGSSLAMNVLVLAVIFWRKGKMR